MKGKRFLPIILLSSALLLTSCEDLLSGFMGGNSRKKSSNNEDSEYYGGEQGYQGKQGATELSEAEWDLAFSLEEFALRRSCHVEAGHSMSMSTMDVDNGKFLIAAQGEVMGYFNFDKIENDMAYVTYYYQGENGSYMSGSEQAPLGYTMAEFGILEYDYNDFKYDSGSKSYKANSFHYEVSYMGQVATSINGSNATIKIEDGFPKSVEFDFEMDGDEEIGTLHYTANYSNYNKTVVKLPDVNGGNGGNGGNNNSGNELPKPEGEEISYEQLLSAYEKREVKEFNHAEYVMTSEGKSYSGSSTLYFGLWEEDQEDGLGLDVSTFVLTEEMLADFETVPGTEDYEIEFYYNAKNAEYIIHAYYDVLGYGISTNIYINKYFYVTAEFIIMADTYTTLEIEWSNVTLPEGIVMKVDHRSFVGVDVKQKDFVYYEATKEVTEATTINFDGTHCEMIITKACSGDLVQEVDYKYIGSYEQNGNTVFVSFDHCSNDEGGYDVLPTTLTYNFEVADDKLIVPTKNMDESGQFVDLDLLFQFDERFSEKIYYPGGSSTAENPLAGLYEYKECKLVVINEEARSEAEAALAALSSQTDTLFLMTITIDDVTDSLIYQNINGARYYGDYTISGENMEVEFTAYYSETGEYYDPQGQKMMFKFIEGDIYLPLYESSSDYIIYGVFSRD